jgi:hypothetical protein
MYYIPGLNDQQKTQKQPSTPATEQQQPQNQSQQLPPQQPQQQPQQLTQQQLQQTQPQKHKPKTSKHGRTKRKIFNNNFQIFLQIRIFNLCLFSP